MDDNTSGLSFHAAYGRHTLAAVDVADRSVAGWSQSLHNGFEIWWLAGMPLMLAFMFMLLSFSVVMGMQGLKTKVRWPLASTLWGYVVMWATLSPSASAAALNSANTSSLKVSKH